MNSPIIRQAEISDLPQLQELSHQLYISDQIYYPFFNVNFPFEKGGIDHLKMRILRPESICLIAEKDAQIVGFLIGIIQLPSQWAPVKKIHIENVFIKKNNQRKRIGTRLLEEFLSWSRACGINYCTVSTFAENHVAQLFYKKNGFSPLVVTLEKTFI